MGFLSNLFGGNKEDKALREALAHIHRILDDDAFQLELVHPAMKAMLESAPGYDKYPNGTGPFGFTETNPIPVNGPIGQLAYLSRLEHPVPPPRSYRQGGCVRGRVIQWSRVVHPVR